MSLLITLAQNSSNCLLLHCKQTLAWLASKTSELTPELLMTVKTASVDVTAAGLHYDIIIQLVPLLSKYNTSAILISSSLLKVPLQ